MKIDQFFTCDFCDYKIKKGENYFYFAETDEMMCVKCLKQKRQEIRIRSV